MCKKADIKLEMGIFFNDGLICLLSLHFPSSNFISDAKRHMNNVAANFSLQIFNWELQAIELQNRTRSKYQIYKQIFIILIDKTIVS